MVTEIVNVEIIWSAFGLQIVGYYKFFPLALEIVAGSLRRQPAEVWEGRLRKCLDGSSALGSESNILSSLQSNLHELKFIIKECFMDLGLFPEHQRIPAASLIDMWTELYELEEDGDALLLLYNLTTRNLANLFVTRYASFSYFSCSNCFTGLITTLFMYVIQAKFSNELGCVCFFVVRF